MFSTNLLVLLALLIIVWVYLLCKGFASEEKNNDKDNK
jgi:hypothetical protein